MGYAVFFGSAVIVLGGALGVVFSENPVHSALSLVASLVGVAVLFLQLDAQLVAAVQVIVYASAVVVLFLFVIMLLGVDRRERVADVRRAQTWAAVVLGIGAVVLLLVIAGSDWTTSAQPAASGNLPDPPSAAVTTSPSAADPLTPTTAPAPVDSGERTDPGNIEAVAESMFTRFAWPLQLTAVMLTVAVVGAVILAKRAVQGGSIQLVDEPSEDSEDMSA